MAKNETAKATIYLDGKQAEAALEGLKKRAAELSEALKKAEQAGDQVSMKKIQSELTGVNSAIRSVKKETFDYEKVLKNLNGASLKELKTALRTVEIQMNRMSRTDPGYERTKSQALRLRTEIDKVNNSMRAQQSVFARVADGFNKYFAIAGAAIASFAGLSLTVKSAITAFNDFEERVSNLSALTGLAGDDLKWLGDQAKELSVSTLEGSILVTQSAQDIVDAFTKVGSARPELLKNKEALVEVTKNAIILSNASKIELQPSIEALTMVMNQYNTSATEARRIINAIAAGSKEGAGEIPYITQAFEKAGTVAADAGISIETLVATIETLAPRITQPEIAGRSLKGVLLDLQNGADDTNPSIVGLATALENLGKKNLSITELTKRFGVENITTAKILINNVGELRKYEAAVKDTNVAIEQATVNTDNNNAKLMQAKNRIGLISMELGEKLGPAYIGIISKSTALLKGVSSVVDIFIKYWRIILGATVAVVAFNMATKIQNAYIITSLALETAYGYAKSLLTGKIKLATVAQKAWNLAVKANPLGLILAVIIAVGTAIWQLTNKTKQLTAAQKAINDVEIQAQQNIVEQKLRVADLLKIAASEKQSLDNRKAALDELNRISPEYFGNLTLQTVKTDEARKASDLYSESLIKNARVLAAQQLIVELEKKQIEDTLSGKNTDLGAWEKLKSGAGLNVFKTARNEQILAAASAKKAADAQAEYNEKMQTYQDIIKKNQSTTNPPITGKTGTVEGDDPKIQDGGGSGSKGKTKFDLTKDALTEAFKEEQNLLKEQLLLRNLTQQQYDDEQYALVLAHLLAMRELYALQGESTVDLDSQILDKKLEGQRKIDEEIKSRLDQQQKEVDDTLDAENQAFADNLVAKQKANEEATKSDEDRKKALEEYHKWQIENAAQAGAAAVEEANTLKEAAKGVLNVIREQIKARLIEAVAIQVSKVLIKVPFPFNIAAAAAAAGAVSFLFNKLIPKFEGGGYTSDGPSDKPAGIVHSGEWVAPKAMVKSPQFAPVISWLDASRRSGSFSRVNIPSISGSNARGYATGGFVQPAPSVPAAPGQQTAENNDRLANAIDRLMTWQPSVAIELIKKGLQTLDDINKNRNL